MLAADFSDVEDAAIRALQHPAADMEQLPAPVVLRPRQQLPVQAAVLAAVARLLLFLVPSFRLADAGGLRQVVAPLVAQVRHSLLLQVHVAPAEQQLRVLTAALK